MMYDRNLNQKVRCFTFLISRGYLVLELLNAMSNQKIRNKDPSFKSFLFYGALTSNDGSHNIFLNIISEENSLCDAFFALDNYQVLQASCQALVASLPLQVVATFFNKCRFYAWWLWRNPSP
ncbi:hypothetical protein Droror1_Dr00013924 [Drosera rotundifolia]